MSTRLSLANRLMLGAAIAGQFAVPLNLVGERAWILRHGERVLMRCAPVDPYDAFRGRYVALDLEGAVVEAPVEPPARSRRGLYSRRSGYLVLNRDPDGFFKPGRLTEQRPDAGLYVKVTFYRSGRDQARVVFPFSRYYMEEAQAPQAESLYRREIAKRDAHVAVRVGPDGTAVLEELYVGGEPIYEALQNRPGAEGLKRMTFAEFRLY